MKVAIGLGMTGEGSYDDAATYVAEAEKLGAEYVWSAEAWGHDAVTPLAFLAGEDEDDQARRGHHAGGRAHAGEHGDDGDDAAVDLGRALHHGARRVAGRRSSRAGTACRTASRSSASAR